MVRDRTPQNRSPNPPPENIGFDALTRQDLSRILEIEHACFPHPWSAQSFEEILTSTAFVTLAARNAKRELVGYIIFSEVADELHVLNVAGPGDIMTQD